MTINIRRYNLGEEEQLRQIYIKSTKNIVARDYSKEQIERWVSMHEDPNEWKKRIFNSNPFVAELNNNIIGFAELESNGHIDYFYCYPVSLGAGSLLLKKLENEALSAGLKIIFAEVSSTALTFFSSHGFEITEELNPIICGLPAKQYVMRKTL